MSVIIDDREAASAKHIACMEEISELMLTKYADLKGCIILTDSETNETFMTGSLSDAQSGAVRYAYDLVTRSSTEETK